RPGRAELAVQECQSPVESARVHPGLERVESAGGQQVAEAGPRRVRARGDGSPGEGYGSESSSGAGRQPTARETARDLLAEVPGRRELGDLAVDRRRGADHRPAARGE